MKFISRKTFKSQHLEVTGELDTGLLKDVEKEDSDTTTFTTKYDAVFPVDTAINDITLIITVTGNDVYVEGIGYINEDNEEFGAYANDDLLEFAVQLSDAEKVRLLAAIINR